MATINIANLTFTHKGNYDGSTAYVKNDVVYYATNGNAYIAKQGTTGNVPTNGTYWSQFAAGSGGIWNAGLSLGSAGQSVKVNAAGNALEFGTISSDFVKIASGNTTASTYIDIQGCFSTTYKLYKLFINFSFNAGSYIELGMLKASDNSLDTNTYYVRANGEYNNSGVNNARWTNGTNQEAHRQNDNEGFRLINTWNQFDVDEHSMSEVTFDNPISTRRTMIQNHSVFSSANHVGEQHGIGMLDSATSHSGLRLGSANSATFTTDGYYAVYGLKN